MGNLKSSQQSQLELGYLFSLFPLKLRNQLAGKISIDRHFLIINCATAEEALDLCEETYRGLLYAISAAPQSLVNVKVARYRFYNPVTMLLQNRDVPLYWISTKGDRMQSTKVMEISGVDLSNVPILSDLEIIKIIYNHSSATGLPASCLSINDSHPYFCSDNIHHSCGVTKGEFLRTSNAEDFFPAGELVRYKDAIIQSAGDPIELEYVAANISDRQLCNRKVKAQLVRAEHGDLLRLVRLLQMPEPLGRVLA